MKNSGQHLLKYIRRGEGRFRATKADRHLGLRMVEVKWARKDGQDDGYDDGTIGYIAVTVSTVEGQQTYEFDLAFNGRAVEVTVGKADDRFGT